MYIYIVERGSRIVIRGVPVFDLMNHECNNRCIQWEEEKLDSDLNLKKKLKGDEMEEVEKPESVSTTATKTEEIRMLRLDGPAGSFLLV